MRNTTRTATKLIAAALMATVLLVNPARPVEAATSQAPKQQRITA